MCRVLGKKFRYIGITNCVHVLNKSRGSEMHWVGGGLKSTKGQFPPFYVKTYLCVVFPVFFFYRFMIVDYCILKISLLYLLFFSRFKADS